MQQRLLTDVRLRYYDLLVALEKIRISDQLVEFSQDAVDTTQQLVEAQEMARTALLQAQVELQYAQVTRRQASNELAGARRNLAVLIGEEDLPFSTVTGSLQDNDGLDIEAAFDQILQQSPEIARRFNEVEIARRNLARQCVEPIPDVTWQATILYGLGSDDVVSGLQVGMPIPVLNRNEGAIGQARKEMVAAERNAERTALRLRERLVTAYQSYMDAKLEIEAFNSEILPTSKETIRLVSQGYRQGEVSYLELLVVQRTYFQINLANVDRLGEMWRQRITIEGMLLSGSLQQP
jgi:cobalt-zinc-cadmium efflux system outer membrane protein